NVLIIGGSVVTPGAALLAGLGALRAGAGRLRIVTCSRNATALGIALPEALVLGAAETAEGGIDPGCVEQLAPFLDSADAVLIGPGMTDQDAIDALARALFQKAPASAGWVFDARAISSIRQLGSLRKSNDKPIIITPHAGEMAGLLDRERREIEADPARFAREAATAFHATVALKGARTFIAEADARRLVCCQGNPGLATSGSGDVLAGVIAGLLARAAEPFVATSWGVYLHARAGDHLAERIGPLGFLAREILPEIPRIMQELQ